MTLCVSCRSFLGIDLNFESLESFEKASFVLGSELWEDDFTSMLDLVKDYIVEVWELRKARLYNENLSVPQSQCQNSSGELGDVGDGGSLSCLHGKVDTPFHVCVHVVLALHYVLGAWCMMVLVLWLPVPPKFPLLLLYVFHKGSGLHT